MGKLTVNLSLDNGRTPLPAPIKCRGVVDTGVNFLILPLAWKERFGAIARMRKVGAETASGIVDCEMCGPVTAQIEGFAAFSTEALFVPMKPAADGEYEARLGNVPLDSCGAIVDRKNRKLKKAMYVSAKRAAVYNVNSMMPDMHVIAAGSPDDLSVFAPQMRIYCDSAAPWVLPEKEELPRFDAMPQKGGG